MNTLLTYKSGDTAGYKRCCAELREHLPRLHAQEFLASCKVLFDCGMDAGDNAQVEWVLNAMDAYLRRDPKEAQVGLRAETCRYEYAKATGNTALMLAALEKKETYYALVLARKEEIRVRDAGRYLHIGQQLQNALESEASANRTKTRFLANMSHDIRTPLTGIVGATNVLLEQDDTLTPQQRRELLKNANEDAQWLIRIVENLLSITRIGAGEDAQVTKTPEAAEEVIGSAVAKTHKHYPDVEVCVSVPEELMMVPMDPLLIEQVLVNLMENAVIHGGTSRIDISLTQEGENAVFTVSDNGSGIPVYLLGKLFDGAARSDRTAAAWASVCPSAARWCRPTAGPSGERIKKRAARALR